MSFLHETLLPPDPHVRRAGQLEAAQFGALKEISQVGCRAREASPLQEFFHVITLFFILD